MKKIRSAFSVYLMIGLMVFASFAQADGQTAGNARDVRDILRSINSKIDDFRYSVRNEVGRVSGDRNTESQINDGLRNLSDSLRSFDDKFQKRRETGDDVKDILRSAKYINDSLSINRVKGNKTLNNWTELRGLLDRLAANYGVRSDWTGQNDDEDYDSNDNRFPNDNRSSGNYSSPRASASSSVLTGTYKLDVSRSENTREIADRAISGDTARNDNAQKDLENKLDAPEQLTIEVRGNQVNLSSSRAPQITFTADGRERSETVGGKTIRVRATLRGQELTVASLGGDSDYTVVFAPIENGSAMRVTRRITTAYLRETVFAESIYQKTNSTVRPGDDATASADDNGDYSSNDRQDTRNTYPNGNYPTTTARTGEFIVPNGTILTGILENDIDAGVSQNNDRFRMTVQSPNEYRGAVVEGYLSGINRSGRVSGRSQITFNFERIKLSNGQTYDFAGFLQSVADENGKTVKIDTEGTARGDSQTKETVKRGGIGAGIGAIIGAIAGGPGGAAIGAVIGGGAGAGSVVLQGKDDLKLRKGSSINVQASSPIR